MPSQSLKELSVVVVLKDAERPEKNLCPLMDGDVRRWWEPHDFSPAISTLDYKVCTLNHILHSHIFIVQSDHALHGLHTGWGKFKPRKF